MEPLVSVVLPFHNAEQHLAEAIASIQAQTHARWEMIAVDDGSTDGSAAVAEGFASRDRRVRLVRIRHGGAAVAFNAGVDQARGELIARMDADDVAIPSRFTVQIEWMRRTGVEVCGSCARAFGDRDRLLWFPESHVGIGHELLFRQALLHPALLAHASILRANPYPEGTRFEGNTLAIALRRTHRLGNVPAVLLRYRSHPGQIHRDRWPGLKAQMRAERRTLFRDLFPEAGPSDLKALERVAAREPAATIEELERAGRWLVRLSQADDAFLTQQMLARWRRTCRLSTHLGLNAYRAYGRIEPHFGLPPATPDRSLRSACALRLRWDSPVDRVLRRGRSSDQRVSA